MAGSDRPSRVPERDAEPGAAAPSTPPSLVPPADTLVSLASSRPSAGLRIPATSRSLPPMPAIEPVLEAAAEARAKGDWDGALEHYKKALFLVDGADRTARGSLYAYVAEVKLAQGRNREAETNFEKALGVSPRHLRSIDGLVDLATEAREWPRVALFRRRRAEALEDADEQTAEWCRLADVLEQECGEPQKAVDALLVGNAAHVGDVGILTRLERLLASLRQWPKLVEVLDASCRVSTDPRARAELRFAQADIVLGRLREEARGLAFLELALDEDPQNDRALSALIAVRTRREEWTELAAVYERLLERFAGALDRDRAWEVCRKLGVLRRDRLLDGPGAIEAMRGAVEIRATDVETRASLAELYAAKGDRAAAVAELEIVASSAPLRAQTYRRLYELHVRAQRPDRAWLLATCLEELGATEVSHELVIEQFRPDGPIRPTTALAPEWWDDGLSAAGADPVVDAILVAVADVAIALRLEELAAKKKLPALDPATKQERASTASVVRTFVWAARALGTPLPALHVLEDVPHGMAAIPAAHPAVALGPSVRAGLTVQQLAFLAGRHLTYYRPAHYALVFFPSVSELSSLVLAAVGLVVKGLSLPPGMERDRKVTSELGPRLSADKRTALEAAVALLEARGGTLDLGAWVRHVELTAARAGLLLAGDLRIPMRMLGDETRALGELSVETKRGDLVAFCASEAYGRLRERMGVAIHGSSIHASSAKI